jgi:hypothetical protein
MHMSIYLHIYIGTMAPKKKMNKASLSRVERTKLLVTGRKKEKERQMTTAEEEKSRYVQLCVYRLGFGCVYMCIDVYVYVYVCKEKERHMTM